MLREAVTQLRLAFVQLTDALAALDERTAAEEAGGDDRLTGTRWPGTTDGDDRAEARWRRGSSSTR